MATSPAMAYAMGSPAINGAASSMLGSLPSFAGGMPSIPSLTQSSSADGKVSAGFNNSGFVVNQGGGVASAGGMPGWLLPLAAMAGLALVLRHKGGA